MSTKRPDTCGCAMGARFMGVALVAALIYYGFFAERHLSLGARGARVALVTFLAAGLGKVVGLLLYRRQRAAALARVTSPQT